MDMTSVDEVLLTADPADWRAGDSWLAGGTVLYSYGTDVTRGRPHRLLDLGGADWPAARWHDDPDELELAGTCPVAAVYALPEDPDLPARRRTLPGLSLFRPCCDAFVASYKIWTVSTVGGNVATALPAGPMTSLLAGLDAVAVVLGPGGTRRELPVAALVTGATRTGLGDGELIRCFRIPVAALEQPCAFRRISLTERGRSAALLIGRRTGPASVRITVTAATPRPVVVDLTATDRSPVTAEQWRRTVDAAVAAVSNSAADDAGADPDGAAGHEPADTRGWYDDVHGAPAWRRAMTHRLGEELLAELLPDHSETDPAAVGRTTGDLAREGATR